MTGLGKELSDFGDAMRAGLAVRQAYFLEGPSTASAKALPVLSFEAVQRLREPYDVTVQPTHPLMLDRADQLDRDDMFLIDRSDGSEACRLAGRITRFLQTRQTQHLHGYEIVIELPLARLRLTQASRIYRRGTDKP
ncbi:hypothetical protein [Cupriavidus pauculus]|uniref:hypothetical protein n=1 Tax=Cupriavidus pauculus TaxID=82633 RepID=UPI0012478BF8|nr:hypothetical protein [Cupriavidus pauculus]KAB0595494.1 hypothetical protein F7R19_28505 [Cupriavidus pauculus]MCM3608913.1 hypothetical protein [Cupriavidus pauculus]UAL00362.1 hypothetical protein K8O84_03000 [Cupriavidus pauculus]